MGFDVGDAFWMNTGHGLGGRDDLGLSVNAWGGEADFDGAIIIYS